MVASEGGGRIAVRSLGCAASGALVVACVDLYPPVRCW